MFHQYIMTISVFGYVKCLYLIPHLMDVLLVHPTAPEEEDDIKS